MFLIHLRLDFISEVEVIIIVIIRRYKKESFIIMSNNFLSYIHYINTRGKILLIKFFNTLQKCLLQIGITFFIGIGTVQSSPLWYSHREGKHVHSLLCGIVYYNFHYISFYHKLTVPCSHSSLQNTWPGFVPNYNRQPPSNPPPTPTCHQSK